MAETQTPISWGDEIRPDSVWSLSHLGYNPSSPSATLVLVVLSRDGSRRIVRATLAGVAGSTYYPDQAVLSTPDDNFQNWEGIKLHAEWLKEYPTQTVLMLQAPKGEGHHRNRDKCLECSCHTQLVVRPGPYPTQ